MRRGSDGVVGVSLCWGSRFEWLGPTRARLPVVDGIFGIQQTLFYDFNSTRIFSAILQSK